MSAKKSPHLSERRFCRKEWRLLFRLVPHVLADEGGQTAAVGGLALEGIAGALGGLEGDAFEDFSGDGLLGLDVVELVFHAFLHGV